MKILLFFNTLNNHYVKKQKIAMKSRSCNELKTNNVLPKQEQFQVQVQIQIHF